MSLVTFYIWEAAILFSFFLANRNGISIYFNNMKNAFIQANKCYQVVRRQRYAFLTWYIFIFNITMKFMNINPYYLIELELRHLHRRFDHLFVKYLYNFFERSGHNINLLMLEYLTKYRHHCQKYEKALETFSFFLKDDADF